MPGDQAYRHDALALRQQHPRHRPQLVERTRRDRDGERDEGIATLDAAEGSVDHVGDGIEPEQAEQDERHRQGNAG